MELFSKIIAIVLVLTLVGSLFMAMFSHGTPGQTATKNNMAPEPSGETFQQFAEDELDDKCATPPGYTDDKWKEHLGHHPDKFAECL